MSTASSIAAPDGPHPAGWPQARRDGVLLLGLVLAVFWPALSGGLVYDDQINFRLNTALRECRLWELCTQPFFLEQMSYWRPVATLSMAFAYHVGELPGVHLFAVLVHAAAAVVACSVARRVMRNGSAAFMAAMLFALHPVQVESVAWASAVSEPLCALFGLLAVAAALAWRDAQRGVVPWAMATWLFAALLSKEAGITILPLVLGVVAVSPGRVARKRWLSLVATGMVTFAVWVLLRSLVMARPFGGPMEPRGAAPDLLAAEVAQMIVRPLMLLVVPHPLIPFHALQSELAGSQLLAAVVWVTLLGAVAAVLVWALRASTAAVRFGAVFLFVPLLLPMLRYRSLGDHPMAERYLYVPAFGLALWVAALGQRWPWALAGLAVSCAWCSHGQSAIWRDQRQLAMHCVAAAPRQPIAHLLLGNVHLTAMQAGDDEALWPARDAYGAALRLLEDPLAGARNRQRAAARIGLTWCDLLAGQRSGHVDTGSLIADFRAAIALDEAANSAWVGLGVACALAKRYGDAQAAFRRALQLDERCPEAWFNLGYMQLQTRRRTEGRHSLRQALRLDPDLTAAADLLAGPDDAVGPVLAMRSPRRPVWTRRH